MEFLNYHHLRYFWTVAKEGGLTKAAVNSTSPNLRSARRFRRSKVWSVKNFFVASAAVWR